MRVELSGMGLVLYKRNPLTNLVPSTIDSDPQEDAAYEPRRWHSSDPVGVLILNFQPPEL